MTKINYPIINSMMDDDWYKYTMGSVVFHLFPRAIVEYTFINRGKTQFPEGFDEELKQQILFLADLKLDVREFRWLNTIPYLRPTYIEWLKGYRMNPNEVDVKQNGGDLEIKIRGPWYRTIFWEVKLMAIISELYFKLTDQTPSYDWVDRINKKASKLENAECHWIDFGTRRRFSAEVQDKVVEKMCKRKGFLGTSNPYLAYKHGVTPHGTYAHESFMAMSALYGVRMANKMWMKHWSEHFEGNVGVALTDTFTSDFFWKDFGTYEARLFDGCRQDSGDPYDWGWRMIEHYSNLNIPISNKRMVFSDALDDDKFIKLNDAFKQYAQPIGGIGTFFTNDVGVKSLNMVIKMTKANFGQGMVNVVKLSDDKGKHTGNSDAIRRAKEEISVA